jgi:hypothetical protein
LLVFAQTELRPKPTLRATDDSLNTGAIAGGVVGAILFLILVFLIFLWVQRRIGIKEHEESVRVKLHFLKNIDIFCYILLIKFFFWSKG